MYICILIYKYVHCNYLLQAESWQCLYRYYEQEIQTLDNHFNAKLDKYVLIYKYVKCNHMLQDELGLVCRC